MKRTCTTILFSISLVLGLSTIALAAPGDLDPRFSGDGKLIDWETSAAGVAIQPDGKVVVVGTGPFFPNFDFRIARYNPDGTPDASFGTGNGRVRTDIGEEDPALGVLIQPDGKIVVAGTLVTAQASNFVLARYNSDGSPDTHFGGGTGLVITSSAENCGFYDYGTYGKIVIQPDGKLLGILGYEDWDGNCQWPGLMFRYHPDGALDTAFGNNGIVYSEGEWGAGALWSVAVQPSDGKIVSLGYRFIRRFNTNGSVDVSFGTDGTITIPYPAFVLAVAVQPDGKILAAGSTSEPEYDAAIYRLKADGSPDASFGNGGLVTTPIGPSSNWANSIAIQPDGRIVTSGPIPTAIGYNFTLARHNPNGSPDRGFGGGDGFTFVDFNNFSDDFPRHLALDPSGRAVVVGRSNSQFAIACFSIGRQRIVDLPLDP